MKAQKMEEEQKKQFGKNTEEDEDKIKLKT